MDRIDTSFFNTLKIANEPCIPPPKLMTRKETLARVFRQQYSAAQDLDILAAFLEFLTPESLNEDDFESVKKKIALAVAPVPSPFQELSEEEKATLDDLQEEISRVVELESESEIMDEKITELANTLEILTKRLKEESENVPPKTITNTSNPRISSFQKPTSAELTQKFWEGLVGLTLIDCCLRTKDGVSSITEPPSRFEAPYTTNVDLHNTTFLLDFLVAMPVQLNSNPSSPSDVQSKPIEFVISFGIGEDAVISPERTVIIPVEPIPAVSAAHHNLSATIRAEEEEHTHLGPPPTISFSVASQQSSSLGSQTIPSHVSSTDIFPQLKSVLQVLKRAFLCPPVLRNTVQALNQKETIEDVPQEEARLKQITREQLRQTKIHDVFLALGAIPSFIPSLKSFFNSFKDCFLQLFSVSP